MTHDATPEHQKAALSIPLTLTEAILINGLVERLGMSTTDAIRLAMTTLIEMAGSVGEKPDEMPSIARLEANLSAMKTHFAVNDAANRRGFELIYESVEAIRADVSILVRSSQQSMKD